MNYSRIAVVYLLLLQVCFALKAQTNTYQHPFAFPNFGVGGCYTICIKEKSDLSAEERNFLKENLLRFSPMAYTHKKKTRKKILRFGVKRRKSDTPLTKKDEKKKRQITYSSPVIPYTTGEPIRKIWKLTPSQENCLSMSSENCMTWCLEQRNPKVNNYDHPVSPNESHPNNLPEGWYVDFNDELESYEEWVIPPIVQKYEYFEEVIPPSEVVIVLKSDNLDEKQMAYSIAEGMTGWVRTSPCLEHGKLWNDIQKSLELRGYKMVSSQPQSDHDYQKQQDTLEAITDAYLKTKGWNNKYLDYEALELLGINSFEKDTLFAFGDSTSIQNSKGLLFFHVIPPYDIPPNEARILKSPFSTPNDDSIKYYKLLRDALVENLQPPRMAFDTIFEKVWIRKGIKTEKKNKVKRKDFKKITWENQRQQLLYQHSYYQGNFESKGCWESCVRSIDKSLILKYTEYPAKYKTFNIEILDESSLPTYCKTDSVLQENEKWVLAPKFEVFPIYKPKTSKAKIPLIPVPSDEADFFHHFINKYSRDWVEIQQPCCIPAKPKRIPAIEMKLKEKGYYKGKVRGVLSEELKEAIIKFQKDNKLPVGQINIDTLRALEIEY